MKRIGILALQGSVREHIDLLKKIKDVVAFPLRYSDELDTIDGLIIPGGESTTIRKLLIDFKLLEPIKQKILNGLPVWGTCAGLIVLAKQINDEENSTLGVMDIHAHRNAYGRQLDSFVATECIDVISENPIPMVFIRAPYISKVGPKVQILKTLQNQIVAARQENMFVTAFHPELTQDTSVHEYFLSMT